MMKKIGLAVGLLLLASPVFADWQYRESKDAMTDRIEFEARVLDNEHGVFFRIKCRPPTAAAPGLLFFIDLQQYFKFGLYRVMFRFDDKPPREFDFAGNAPTGPGLFSGGPDLDRYFFSEGGGKTLRMRVNNKTMQFDNSGLGEVFAKVQAGCNFKIPKTTNSRP